MTSDTNRPLALFEGDHLSTVADRLAETEGVLFCTDFDGTLAEIAEDPDAPELTSANREALLRLCDHDRVHVAVISGRELTDLRSRVGIEEIDYAGNHGLELRRDDETTVHPVAEKRKRELDAIIGAIEDRLADTDCFVEDKSVSATIHYRAAPDRAAEVSKIVESAVETVASGGFELSSGKEIVELTPEIAWDKGRALSLLAAEYEGWLTIYVGDDTTDEAAFRVLSDGIGIHVGASEETAADYRIESPEAVERFLDWLCHAGLDALDSAESPENRG